MSVTSEQIDQFILATFGNRFSKVAKVISTTADGLGIPTHEGDPGLDLIAERIEALVENGRLISQGNLKKWRFSEVRQP